MPVTVMDTLRLYMGEGGKYALVNTVTQEYAKVPLFIANEWRGDHYITTRGPFVFRDGFAQEPEAAYLLQMLQYVTLTGRAATKVKDIQSRYSDWIGYDEEVRLYLKEHIKWL